MRTRNRNRNTRTTLIKFVYLRCSLALFLSVYIFSYTVGFIIACHRHQEGHNNKKTQEREHDTRITSRSDTLGEDSVASSLSAGTTAAADAPRHLVLFFADHEEEEEHRHDGSEENKKALEEDRHGNKNLNDEHKDHDDSTTSSSVRYFLELPVPPPAPIEEDEDYHTTSMTKSGNITSTTTTTTTTRTATRTIAPSTKISNNNAKGQHEGDSRSRWQQHITSQRRIVSPLSFSYSSSSTPSSSSSCTKNVSAASSVAGDSKMSSSSFALMSSMIICELKENKARGEKYKTNVLETNDGGRTNKYPPNYDSSRKTDDNERRINLLLMEPSPQKPSSLREHSTIFVIAAAPFNLMRLLALWSQLECFVSKQEQYDTILIAAPEEMSNHKRQYFERFVQHAVDSIPHLKDVHVVVQYHVNDRYDVGLWCDALRISAGDDATTPLSTTMDISRGDDQHSSDINDNLSIWISKHDEFVLTNDSVMAIQPNFTAVLDALRGDKNLMMTSLNYSFHRGLKGENSFGNRPWLESVFRAFNRDGLERYMNHACVPASHSNFCPQVEDMEMKKRCIVETMEIQVADLFDPNQVKGLFPSDVPHDMIKSEALEHVYLWHSHFNFWRHELVDKMKFPAMKISNEIFVKRAVNRAKKMFFKCTKFLDPMLLEDMQEMFE